MLITVLGNLIENALMRWKASRKARLACSCTYQNGWLSGEVSDDGPGIDPERLEVILQRATQQR